MLIKVVPNGGIKTITAKPDIMHVSELLGKYNFRGAGTCNCNAIYTEKFKNDRYLLRVRPRRNQHRLFELDGTTAITHWITLVELKNKFNELYNTDIQEQTGTV